MSNLPQNQYAPDEVSPPGETLAETLKAIGITQKELAARSGRPIKTINEIIKGKTAITFDTALQFERVLGISASFWNNRERHYQEALARKREVKRLQEGVEWLKRTPIRAMVRLGWVRRFKNRVLQMQELLNFFGIASPEQYPKAVEGQVAYRKPAAFSSNPDALAAWLRKGQIEVQRIICAPYDRAKFQEALKKIRALTPQAPEAFVPEMTRLCSECGVAVVFVPELPGTRAHGATRWLGSAKALIQLSLRYKSDDQLWFSFFHEAGHILLHGKQDVFVEGAGGDPVKEKQANRFAERWLIPEDQLQLFMHSGQRSIRAIEGFAREMGIAPGIIVGRLQHEGHLPRNHCNHLKRSLEWTST